MAGTVPHVQAQIDVLRSQMDPLIQAVNLLEAQMGLLSGKLDALSGVVKQTASEGATWHASVEGALRGLQTAAL